VAEELQVTARGRNSGDQDPAGAFQFTDRVSTGYVGVSEMHADHGKNFFVCDVTCCSINVIRSLFPQEIIKVNETLIRELFLGHGIAIAGQFFDGATAS
jgi:hypothetical protein